MITCRCPAGHPDHRFDPGEWSLCKRCGHAVGAHKAWPPEREVVELITRLVRSHDIEEWSAHVEGDVIQLVVSLSAVSPAPGAGRVAA